MSTTNSANYNGQDIPFKILNEDLRQGWQSMAIFTPFQIIFLSDFKIVNANDNQQCFQVINRKSKIFMFMNKLSPMIH